MPRFRRRPVSIRAIKPANPSPAKVRPSDEAIADFILAVIRTQVDPGSIDMLKAAVKKVIADNSPDNVVSLVTTLVGIQVGEDENESPMLVSLVDDLGASAEEVELAQDIILAGRDITLDIAKAVQGGDPKSVLWGLMARVGQLIPELEEDINKLKASQS